MPPNNNNNNNNNENNNNNNNNNNNVKYLKERSTTLKITETKQIIKQNT